MALTAHAVPKTARLVSLDALRGIAIVIMVFVNAGGAPALHTDHVPWDSRDAPLLHLADYACPFFVFCIGASMAVSFTGAHAKPRPKLIALRHAAWRTTKLVLVGFFVKNGEIVMLGGDKLDMRTARLVSVLGRLGFSYFVAAALIICFPAAENDTAADSRPSSINDPESPLVTQIAAGSTQLQFSSPIRDRAGAIHVPDEALDAHAEHVLRKRSRTNALQLLRSLLPEVAVHWKAWIGALAVLTLYLALTFGALPASYAAQNRPPLSPCPHGYLGPGGTAEHGANFNCTGGFMGWFDAELLTPRHEVDHGEHGEFCFDKYKCPKPFDDNGFFGCLPTIFHIFLGASAAPSAPALPVLRVLTHLLAL